MAIKTEYHKIRPYTTKDDSLIRELMHPEKHGNSSLSLAEATIPAGSTTILHRHPSSHEIYHISVGSGLMTIETEKFNVKVGDTIYIPPGMPHQIQNTGKKPLKLLCCCYPPYSHADTELLTDL